MIRILATTFAALLGLAFGSFLNVCLSRWPQGESIVHPRSHCRNCEHTLAWWENIPLLSWLILRARCRNCHTAISWRYPLVELAVGVLWAINAWKYSSGIHYLGLSWIALPILIVCFLGPFTFLWLLVALAALDAENFWLPDKLTLPGILGGVFVAALYRFFFEGTINGPMTFINFFLFPFMQNFWRDRLLEILIAALLILIIRWLYKLLRHRDGIGLGDAKLMALLAAWLGLPGALLSFVLAAILGALAALILLVAPRARTDPQSWATSKLPFGTFLCIGGIVSSLWGQPILATYYRWAGF
jgi:leader peptidase (prepilin peptidase)/N-methyltransferase